MGLESLDLEIRELLKSKINTTIKNKDKALRELSEILYKSVDKHIRKDINFGLAFSGGIDSSLIAFLCKKLKRNFKLYTISIGEGEDLIWARKIASNLKLPITTKIINYDEAYETIKNVTKILNHNHPVMIGIGCTPYTVFNLIKNDKLEHVVTGLGSDTLFCGFEKHKRAFEENRIEEEILHGLENIYPNDVERDLKLAKLFNLKLICPYLDKDVVNYSLKIDPKLKINGEEKKIILRELALNFGLKREFSNRKKLAAQYGSGFDKAISVFTKENGFKYKRDFLSTFLKNK